MVKVPIELPGETVPLLNTLPVVPEPPKVPAAATVTGLVRLPFTDSLPEVTVVAPV